MSTQHATFCNCTKIQSCCSSSAGGSATCQRRRLVGRQRARGSQRAARALTRPFPRSPDGPSSERTFALKARCSSNSRSVLSWTSLTTNDAGSDSSSCCFVGTGCLRIGPKVAGRFTVGVQYSSKRLPSVPGTRTVTLLPAASPRGHGAMPSSDTCAPTRRLSSSGRRTGTAQPEYFPLLPPLRAKTILVRTRCDTSS